MNWHDYFTYDPGTGNLIWKPRDGNDRFNTRLAGKVAGDIARANGRITGFRVCVNYRRRRVHRIVWEMHHGPIPKGLNPDHIDVNPLNNRLSNLRLATDSQNSCNQRTRKGNKSGLKGVSWDQSRGKWAANITVLGKQKNLGRFDSKGMAAVTYAKAALRLHGDFARF